MSHPLGPHKDFRRGRWMKPIIKQPDGSEKLYRRVTKFIDVVEDKYNLQQWEKQQVAIGLADRPDLLLSVTAHRDDKGRLNELCDQAKEASKASVGSVTGTALHALTDMQDRGDPLPALPEGAAASLEAFRVATASLGVERIEMACVQDWLEAAGTADRLYKAGSKLVIGDTKSGNVKFGTLKIAMQLAVYARSYGYDTDTETRYDHGADFHRAIVMHLPRADNPADAVCELYWIDLEAGWQAVLTARDVHERRRARFESLTEPFVPEQEPELLRMGAKAALKAAATVEDVREIYRKHREVWNNDLDAEARRRANELAQVAS